MHQRLKVFPSAMRHQKLPQRGLRLQKLPQRGLRLQKLSQRTAGLSTMDQMLPTMSLRCPSRLWSQGGLGKPPVRTTPERELKLRAVLIAERRSPSIDERDSPCKSAYRTIPSLSVQIPRDTLLSRLYSASPDGRDGVIMWKAITDAIPS